MESGGRACRAIVVLSWVFACLEGTFARGSAFDGEAALFLPTRAAADDEKVAKAEFLKKYGDRYGYGGRIDDLYAKEIAPRLSPNEHYMDHTAAGLYWNSQIAAVAAELQRYTFGNPHCTSPSAQRTEHIVEATRKAVLDFFGADPNEYTVVFTRSGTGALKMVGELFPWTPTSSFTHTISNHNSVLGIREYAKHYEASVVALEEEQVWAWLDKTIPAVSRRLSEDHSSTTTSTKDPTAAAAAAQDPGTLEAGQAVAEVAASENNKHKAGKEDKHKHHNKGPEPTYSLFAYPAYDNYAGVKYPLSWVKEVQARSNATHVWKVLLDTAAFVPTHRLNLTETPADFVVMSWYKLFGYPTGVGALILRNENIPLLREGFWGGGSVFLATSSLDWKVWYSAPRRYEHGTVAFLDIISITHGLRVYEELGGIGAVEEHVAAVGEYLYERMSALRHSNSKPMVRVFGKHAAPDRRKVQGSTLNFELLGSTGKVLSYKTAGYKLGLAGFHVRTGCTCNPGACYNATGVRDQEVHDTADQTHGHFENWEWTWVRRHGKLVQRPLGSLRVSLGMMSRFEDVHALAEYIKQTYTDVELVEELTVGEAQTFPLHPGGC